MSIEFDHTRYRSNALISSEEILEHIPDILIDATPVWANLHDLARSGWEMKVVSSGGVHSASFPALYQHDEEPLDSYVMRCASWTRGRTHVHLRRSNQQNYGIKLTIPGRFYNVHQLREALVSRTYTSTLGLTIKCLEASPDGPEQAIEKYGWGSLMDARLRMVDQQIGSVADNVRRARQPDPHLPGKLARVASHLEAHSQGKVVALRGVA